nr:integrase, catalytic core [Tanacetum cinerariifolium]
MNRDYAWLMISRYSISSLTRHKNDFVSDLLIDFQIKFSLSIGEIVTHWFTLIALSALRRSGNESMLGLVILIPRSILTDLQETSKRNGGRYEHGNPVSLKAQDGGDHMTMNRDYAWLMISRHSISSLTRDGDGGDGGDDEMMMTAVVVAAAAATVVGGVVVRGDRPPQQPHQNQIHSAAIVLPSDPINDQIYKSTPHSTSREYTLETQLLKIEMHSDKTPDAYLNRAQKYADALAAIDEPVKDKDLVMLAVLGLREEYNGLKTTITARQSPTAFSELHALLSDHDYMLGKTRAPAPSITLSFAANYALGSPSMPEARQAQLSELTSQLSALGFQVSPIAPYGLQAFYDVRPLNNMNNNNRGNRNNSCGNNNRGRGNGCQFDWTSTQNIVYGTCNRCGIGHIPSQCPNCDPSTIHTCPSANFANTLSHLSPTSQNSPESSNGQPFPVSTTSIPKPPPPIPPPPQTPITRQHRVNLHQNPKQRVPYNPSVNHAIVLPTTITEPTSFTVANNSLEWRQAMKEDYDALMKNRTQSLVPRTSNTNVVDGKWVYKLKRDKNGAITCHKARFVAKGFRQQPGIDFHKTFSPVVMSTKIRAVLSLAITNNWPLRQLDIQNAFHHGNLKEKVYMKQPSSCIDPQRTTYGTIDNIICKLGSAFAIKDLEPLNYFLGIEIVPHVFDILLSQKKYILELLQSVGLSNYTHVSSLMVTSSSLSLDDSTAFSYPVKYRQIVASLQYVTLSRPDIAFAVNKVRLNMVCSYLVLLVLPFKILLACYAKVILIVLLKLSQMLTGLEIQMIDKSEYKALIDTVTELTWLQALLNELIICSSSTPILWCDNLGATYLSANPIFYACTKHMEIDYHFVREKVAQGDLRV